MKKRLSEFELFERTKTPHGIMMRVPGGWELNGAYIQSDKSGGYMAEVYEPEQKRDITLDKMLKILLSNKREEIVKAFRVEYVPVSKIKEIFKLFGAKDEPLF